MLTRGRKQDTGFSSDSSSLSEKITRRFARNWRKINPGNPSRFSLSLSLSLSSSFPSCTIFNSAEFSLSAERITCSTRNLHHLGMLIIHAHVEGRKRKPNRLFVETERENHFCISENRGIMACAWKSEANCPFPFAFLLSRSWKGKRREREKKKDRAFTSIPLLTLGIRITVKRERIDLCPGMANDRRKEVSSYCRVSLNSPLARNAWLPSCSFTFFCPA